MINRSLGRAQLAHLCRVPLEVHIGIQMVLQNGQVTLKQLGHCLVHKNVLVLYQGAENTESVSYILVETICKLGIGNTGQKTVV